jgi:7-cyano-7-deazaguanine tRNA-ribosyltransferase
MGLLEFEIKSKDIAGRIGKLRIGSKEIETPTLMPVFQPNNPLITPKELEEKFHVKALMTNAYIFLKKKKLGNKDLKNENIAKFLNFSGVIATDSGSYQLMQYGSLNTSNEEILQFQKNIGVDIGAFLDIPTLPFSYKKNAEKDLMITFERAKEAKKYQQEMVINAGIQGSTFLDLRKKAAKKIGKDFQLCAIGGIVRLMEEYRFSDLVDIIVTVKRNISSDKVVHGFGLGHPMSFGLVIALGIDLMDSAAYALYASDDRYLTSEGTKKVEELEYLPCSCPICEKYDDAKELKELTRAEREKELARHNLYITFEELRKIKQAIKENSLWEFLGMRARSHPELLLALRRIRKYKKFLAKLDLITKKQGFYSFGSESKHRTEVVNAKERLKRVNSKNTIKISPFGKIPLELKDIYPFNSMEISDVDVESVTFTEITDIEKVKRILEYQFGSGASNLLSKKVRIKKSKKTGRIRWIYEHEELIASIRARDHFVIPKTPLAKKLHEKFTFPKLRVVIHEDAVPFVLEGKSVFAKFVLNIDKSLRAGDEVLVVDKKDNLIAIGTLVLAPKEAMDFERGVAVKVR